MSLASLQTRGNKGEISWSVLQCVFSILCHISNALCDGCSRQTNTLEQFYFVARSSAAARRRSFTNSPSEWGLSFLALSSLATKLLCITSLCQNAALLKLLVGHLNSAGERSFDLSACVHSSHSVLWKINQSLYGPEAGGSPPLTSCLKHNVNITS